ncbi:MAG: gamma carbonic anhydrase family protein [Sulfobacillus sp.]
MLLKFGEFEPVVDHPVFIAPGSYIIGQVRLFEKVSIWFNAVVRADAARIVVGPESNVQDGAVLHADPGFPCEIGARVTIGHRAVVHGARVDDSVLIGMGAIIMNGAHIGHHSIIGAGTVVAQGMEIPPGHLVMGVPGRIVRALTPDEGTRIAQSSQHYVELWLNQGWQFH